MERVLSPDMKNSAAATYITGDYELYNANNYYSYGSTEEYFKITAGTTIRTNRSNRWSPTACCTFRLTRPSSIRKAPSRSPNITTSKARKKFYLNSDGEDVYDLLYNEYADDANEFGYIPITEEN